jgi:hypothetical protein
VGDNTIRKVMLVQNSNYIVFFCAYYRWLFTLIGFPGS